MQIYRILDKFHCPSINFSNVSKANDLEISTVMTLDLLKPKIVIYKYTNGPCKYTPPPNKHIKTSSCQGIGYSPSKLTITCQFSHEVYATIDFNKISMLLHVYRHQFYGTLFFFLLSHLRPLALLLLFNKRRLLQTNF